jgi:hypothetical protein
MHQKNREDANLAYGYKKCRIPTEKQREVTTTQLATHIKSKTTLFFFWKSTQRTEKYYHSLATKNLKLYGKNLTYVVLLILMHLHHCIISNVQISKSQYK